MILIDAGENSDRGFDAKLILASQLSARGHAVAIDENTLPYQPDIAQKYQATPYLADRADIAPTHFLLTGAENIDPETLLRLQSCRLDPDCAVLAVGHFPDHQAILTAKSKLAYVLGREPQILDLSGPHHQPFFGPAISPMLASGPAMAAPRTRPALSVILSPEVLADAGTVATLAHMDQQSGYRLSLILTEPEETPRHHPLRLDMPIYLAGDLPPTVFAGLADIAVFLGDDIPSERLAILALDMMQGGRVVIDCTASSALLATGAPALRGPEALAALPAYIQQTILANLDEIGRFVRKSTWLRHHTLDRLEAALKLTAAAPVPAPAPAPPRTVFLPTNGIGLGHAQRCSVIAAALQTPAACRFAAFPSCVPLIEGRGFACLPLVQKSPDHIDSYANDLVNYLRLRRTLGPGDTLVFDGGLIFESIYRLIFEQHLRAIWIRRGLWQANQDNSAWLRRGHAFEKVIVPGEAFDELNAPVEYGRAVHPVGPVVQTLAAGAPDRKTVRAGLRARFGHPVRELVVTMLGGGKAADRSAQLQTLCNMFERRADCLNLIVVWPGSQVPTGLYGWKNTRIVQTRDALSLCIAADMAISAAGYNSFHEMLYHAVPSILMPQMAPMMDDQERRARSASERGLAETVLAHQLFQLEREVAAFLDGGKAADIRARLITASLPQRGNQAAAQLIEEGHHP